MEKGNSQFTGVLPEDGPTLSKNRLKKLRRDREWEAKRDVRKQIRKQKVKEKKVRNRAAREEANLRIAKMHERSNDAEIPSTIGGDSRKSRPQPVQLPVTIVIDCGFDGLMHDYERKSLGSQITRSYSDNSKAPFQAHLVISSFGGHLKERFDTLLLGNHRSWKNVRFLEGDFIEAARQASGWMRAPDGGKLSGALIATMPVERDFTSEDAKNGEVVYLTSDSPNNLSCLRPYSTYIIGGIVDKNRHKGICYKKATEAGIKTAKLPIGDYMQMNSRFVLATNHVSEIMIRWLENGDWGKAFEIVMPKRKGGVLKQKELTIGESSEKIDDEQEGHEVGNSVRKVVTDNRSSEECDNERVFADPENAGVKEGDKRA